MTVGTRQIEQQSSRCEESLGRAEERKEKSEVTTTRLPNSTADRISNLPCNVIERILVFLPIKAAVQTSILSRNWRHRWRITPQLVFDESFRNWHDENKLMVDIYGALLLHDGPITKFELAIRGSTVESSQVDRLILHLSRKVVGNDAIPISSYSAVKYELDMVALFASLPALQQLTLGIQLLLGHVPYRLPAALQRLKVLEVPRILLDSLPQARVLVCLIMSSPNLQTLTIRIDPEDGGSSPSDVIASLRNLLEAEDRPGVCCLQHLEELHIQDSRGTRVELDLVRFVLATAPQLRGVSIKPNVNLPFEEGMEFLKEVASYKRISREAEVTYIDE
ncbi:unnamed protein product [Linum tenue]|uniref:F-box domain-containing protein n=1 Tax=Linum tenue TaxID=586396 RepID=A0AAV0NK51_9ROSI|nr:unnamed protein product [Linum tenue]